MNRTGRSLILQNDKNNTKKILKEIKRSLTRDKNFVLVYQCREGCKESAMNIADESGQIIIRSPISIERSLKRQIDLGLAGFQDVIEDTVMLVLIDPGLNKDALKSLLLKVIDRLGNPINKDSSIAA